MDTKCSFYDMEESVEHLFFKCEYTGALWRLILQKCGVYRTNESWRKEKQWYMQHLRGKSLRKMVCKLALQCSVAAVWYERNMRTFEGKQSCKDIQYFQIVNTIIHRVGSWKGIKRSRKNWEYCLSWGFLDKIFK